MSSARKSDDITNDYIDVAVIRYVSQNHDIDVVITRQIDAGIYTGMVLVCAYYVRATTHGFLAVGNKPRRGRHLINVRYRGSQNGET